MKKFENYCLNLKVLAKAKNEDLNNEFIVGGIIDKFFVQFELGWKVRRQKHCKLRFYERDNKRRIFHIFIYR